ncbi:hypothetical protein Tco_0832268 [Tanacetum coccineum]
MDVDLFTYEVEVANIPCDSKMDDDSEHEADDDMGYDPSDVAFTDCWDRIFQRTRQWMHYILMKAIMDLLLTGSEEMMKLSSLMKNLLMIRMKLLKLTTKEYKDQDLVKITKDDDLDGTKDVLTMV